MKKIFTLALAASMMAGAAQAQEAFKHMGMSLEVGTTGAGINLSYPLVTDHLIVTVGCNLPAFTLCKDATIGAGAINSKISETNKMIDSYNGIVQQLTDLGLNPNSYQKIDHINPISDIKASVDAKVNFVNYKALLEYYPTTQSNFHFTAGVFVGNGDWINIDATADANTWATYMNVREINSKIPASVPNHPEIHQIEGLDECVKFNIDGQTVLLRPQSKGVMKAKLQVEKVKPYLGVGFGSSIPKKSLGFQMEIGAYCQGSPKLVSADDNTVILPTYDSTVSSEKSVDDIVQTVKKFGWYPQLTFRFTGRLF